MSCQFSAPVSSVLAEAAFIEASGSITRNSAVGLHQDLYIGRRQYLTLLIASFVFLTKVSINASYLGKKKCMDVYAIISGPERGCHVCSKKRKTGTISERV